MNNIETLNIAQLYAARFMAGELKYTVRLYRPSVGEYYDVTVDNPVGKTFGFFTEYTNN